MNNCNQPFDTVFKSIKTSTGKIPTTDEKSEDGTKNPWNETSMVRKVCMVPLQMS